MVDPPRKPDVRSVADEPDELAEPAASAGDPAGLAGLADPLVRAGEVTGGWRIVLAITWLFVGVAFVAIWNTSVQLGRSTWWLGPRGEPMPRPVQLVPFIAPTAMVFATIEHVRWLPLAGIAASIVTAAIAVGDLGRAPSIAAVELIVAGSAAAISLGALTGTYRRPR